MNPIHLIFPARCAACDDLIGAERLFCDLCELVTAPITAGCPSCGVPFDEPIASPCGPCRSRGWPMEQTVAPHEHGTSIRRAVHRLKYNGRSDLAGPLGRLFHASSFRTPGWDLVVPVPLHLTAVLRRGYDQAALLAGSVAARAGARAGSNVIRRTRRTRRQANLAASDRADNVRGAFRVVRPERIQGRTVLLVDDVVTTGATMGACARALRRAGAVRVDGWAIARRAP